MFLRRIGGPDTNQRPAQPRAASHPAPRRDPAGSTAGCAAARSASPAAAAAPGGAAAAPPAARFGWASLTGGIQRGFARVSACSAEILRDAKDLVYEPSAIAAWPSKTLFVPGCLAAGLGTAVALGALHAAGLLAALGATVGVAAAAGGVALLMEWYVVHAAFLRHSNSPVTAAVGQQLDSIKPGLAAALFDYDEKNINLPLRRLLYPELQVEGGPQQTADNLARLAAGPMRLIDPGPADLRGSAGGAAVILGTTILAVEILRPRSIVRGVLAGYLALGGAAIICEAIAAGEPTDEGAWKILGQVPWAGKLSFQQRWLMRAARPVQPVSMALNALAQRAGIIEQPSLD